MPGIELREGDRGGYIGHGMEGSLIRDVDALGLQMGSYRSVQVKVIVNTRLEERTQCFIHHFLASHYTQIVP